MIDRFRAGGTPPNEPRRSGGVNDWNAVVTVYDTEGYRMAKRLMSRYGEIDMTD